MKILSKEYSQVETYDFRTKVTTYYEAVDVILDTPLKNKLRIYKETKEELEECLSKIDKMEFIDEIRKELDLVKVENRSAKPNKQNLN